MLKYNCEKCNCGTFKHLSVRLKGIDHSKKDSLHYFSYIIFFGAARRNYTLQPEAAALTFFSFFVYGESVLHILWNSSPRKQTFAENILALRPSNM